MTTSRSIPLTWKAGVRPGATEPRSEADPWGFTPSRRTPDPSATKARTRFDGYLVLAAAALLVAYFVDRHQGHPTYPGNQDHILRQVNYRFRLVNPIVGLAARPRNS